jgi:hypothetical protein
MDPTQASELMASAQELLLELDAEEWCTPYGLGGGEECIKALQKSIEAITGKPWRKSGNHPDIRHCKIGNCSGTTRKRPEWKKPVLQRPACK